MKKEEKNCCVLTLALYPEKWQIDIIEKRFRIAELLYNSFVGKQLKKYKNLAQTKVFRDIESEMKNIYKDTDKKKRYKELSKMRSKMLVEAGLSERGKQIGFSACMTQHYQHFSMHIGSHTAQCLSEDAWRAFDKMLYGNGQRVHFKKRGSLSSIPNKTGGMKYDPVTNEFTWKVKKHQMTIPVKELKTDYEIEISKLPVKRYRIVRKWMTNKYKYYLQLTLDGRPPKKDRFVGVGRVGLDIGTQSIAIASNTDVKLLELANNVNNNDRKMKLLQRKMDRSRRANNPDNFNEDGTIKRGVKLVWVESNHYKQLRNKVRELHRKNADIRKYQHICLANYTLSLGTEIYVETMNYSALQKRSKKTEKNDKGKYKRKKRFGKSLANKAPAMFLTILDLKLKMLGYEGIKKVDTWTYKASQYDHLSQQYNKKKLSNRKQHLENGDIIQRDLYSAFLIMCSDETLKHQDDNLCNKFYNKFKIMHDEEIKRIKESTVHRLTSFGF